MTIKINWRIRGSMFEQHAALFFIAATAAALVLGGWLFDKWAARSIDKLGEE